MAASDGVLVLSGLAPQEDVPGSCPALGEVQLRQPRVAGARFTDPMQWSPAGRWAQACGELDRSLRYTPGWETLRFGQEVVQV